MKKLLKNFYSGKASRREIKDIFDWFFDKNAERHLNNILEQELNDDQQFEEWNQKESFENIKSRLKVDAGHSVKTRFDWWFYIKIAASLIIVIGSVFFVFRNYIIPDHTATTKAVVEQVKKNTLKGQKLSVFLPDGSKVMLNSSSDLWYNSTWNSDGIRVVHLNGEAFFDIEKDVHRPFVVNINGTTVTALGTSFNILGRAGENVEVSLVSGKVRVVHGAKHLVLGPGEQAVATKNGKLDKQSFGDDVIAWKNGELVFKKSTLEEAVKQMELWYGVDISVLNEPTKITHYSGNFIDKNMSDVLQGMSFVYDFHYEINGKKVQITFE